MYRILFDTKSPNVDPKTKLPPLTDRGNSLLSHCNIPAEHVHKKTFDQFYEECGQDEKLASLHYTHHMKRRNKNLLKVYELYKDLL